MEYFGYLRRDPKCLRIIRTGTAAEGSKGFAFIVVCARRSEVFVASFVVRGSQRIPCRWGRGERSGFIVRQRTSVNASRFRSESD